MQFLIKYAIGERGIFYFIIVNIEWHLLVVVALELLGIGCVFLQLIIRRSSL